MLLESIIFPPAFLKLKKSISKIGILLNIISLISINPFSVVFSPPSILTTTLFITLAAIPTQPTTCIFIAKSLFQIDNLEYHLKL